MSRAWRVVLTLVLILLAAGVVLLGAAWLTGASVQRAIELVFGGQTELEEWLRAGLDRANALWTAALEQLKAIF